MLSRLVNKFRAARHPQPTELQSGWTLQLVLSTGTCGLGGMTGRLIHMVEIPHMKNKVSFYERTKQPLNRLKSYKIRQTGKVIKSTCVVQRLATTALIHSLFSLFLSSFVQNFNSISRTGDEMVVFRIPRCEGKVSPAVEPMSFFHGMDIPNRSIRSHKRWTEMITNHLYGDIGLLCFFEFPFTSGQLAVEDRSVLTGASH